MGYTTDFIGRVKIDPPLNADEISYLTSFAETRRMHREAGPYYTASDGFRGQGHDGDVIDYNSPGPEQPGLWCQWVPTEDGTALEWDGGEKFYYAEEWMRYLIDTFLKPDAAVYSELGGEHNVDGRIYPIEFNNFAFDHVVNGVIEAFGEESGDIWRLTVTNNVVKVQRAQLVYSDDSL